MPVKAYDDNTSTDTNPATLVSPGIDDWSAFPWMREAGTASAGVTTTEAASVDSVKLAASTSVTAISANKISGNSLGNKLLGSGGNEEMFGGGGNDTISGGGGNDILHGGRGNDSILGGSGDDIFFGDGDNDVMRGEAGADSLSGHDGDDKLIGGAGRDRFFGGPGRDTFVFEALSDSPVGHPDGDNHDVIKRQSGMPSAFDGPGAASGDLFDLTKLGDLSWGGTGKGSIYVRDNGLHTLLFVDKNMDGNPDIMVEIYDAAIRASAYTAADFLFN